MNVLARRGKGFNDLQCVGQPSLVPQCQTAETQVSENAIVMGLKMCLTCSREASDSNSKQKYLKFIKVI